jgi:hypothetical protein
MSDKTQRGTSNVARRIASSVRVGSDQLGETV